MSLDNVQHITENQNFNKSNPTSIFCHGFTDNQSSDVVKQIVLAYITFGGHNFVAVDWAEAVAGPDYERVYLNVEPVKSIFFDIKNIDRMEIM